MKKKTFFVFGGGFLEVTSQIGVFLRYFGHLCLAFGAVLMGHFWTQSLVENLVKIRVYRALD